MSDTSPIMVTDIAGIGSKKGTFGVAVNTNATVAFDKLAMVPQINRQKSQQATMATQVMEAIQGGASPSTDQIVLSGPNLPSGAAGLNDGMAEKKQLSSVAMPVEDVLREMDCLTNTTGQQRALLCQKRYGDSGKKACTDDFCSICCRQALPTQDHSTKLLKCTKACNGLAFQSKTATSFSFCVDPGDKKLSLFS